MHIPIISLQVSTVNNTLSIEGKHIDVKEDANASSTTTRQFSRKWTLPDDCKVDLVTSNLSSDGILIVTAPRSGGMITYDDQ